MKSWDLATLGAEPHRPQIVSSSDAARLILIALPRGECLQEHEVHERAWVVVVEGAVSIEGPGTESSSGGPGCLWEFEPKELHEIRATEDSRLLLFLAPWPGDGHPGAMSLDEKSQARRHAAERAADDSSV